MIDQVLPDTTAGTGRGAAKSVQGLMRWLVVSFQAARQEHRAGVRRIQAAAMTAVGLVDSPSRATTRRSKCGTAAGARHRRGWRRCFYDHAWARPDRASAVGRFETRNYTDVLVECVAAAIARRDDLARARSAVQEIAAGHYLSGACRLRRSTGDRGLLTTRLLAEAARDLIVNGEALYKLDVDPLSGAVRLLRATSYSVYGADPDPSTVDVRPLSLYGPTQSRAW